MAWWGRRQVTLYDVYDGERRDGENLKCGTKGELQPLFTHLDLDLANIIFQFKLTFFIPFRFISSFFQFIQ
jgi:hypothetical protein